jgi:TolB protein
MTPVFSPDGSTLYFSNDREGGRIGNFELFSIPLAGGAETRLTERSRADASPALSPDGSRIAFVSTTDGNSEIYLMNSDGTNYIRITRDPAIDSCPRWSPDGRRIIFSSDRSGKVAVYEVQLD